MHHTRVAAYLKGGVMAVAALVMACKDSGPTGTNGSTGSDLFTAAASPVNAVATSDAAHAATKTIGREGGTVTATGADGSTFTLDIPADALADSTAITLTPLTALAGVPLTNGMVAGVQMAPEGLVLAQDATLTIVPAKSVAIGNQTFLSYLGTGTDLHLAVPAELDAPIEIVVQHFSGVALGDGTSADRASLLLKHAADYEARLEQEIAQYLSELRQLALTGTEDGFRNLQALQNALDSFYGHVVSPRVTAASASCANATLALQTLLRFDGQRQRLGIGSHPHFAADLDAVLNAASSKCSFKAGPASVGEFTMAGTICSLKQAFTLTMTTPYGVLPQEFVPSSRTAGTESYSGSLNSVGINGTGSYTVTGLETVDAALQVSDQQCVTIPDFGTTCGNAAFPIPLKRLDHGC